MSASSAYRIHAEWDSEAGVWIATSDDVPGLCVEAGMFEEVVNAVHDLVPELLVANGLLAPGTGSPLSILISAERRLLAERQAA